MSLRCQDFLRPPPATSHGSAKFSRLARSVRKPRAKTPNRVPLLLGGDSARLLRHGLRLGCTAKELLHGRSRLPRHEFSVPISKAPSRSPVGQRFLLSPKATDRPKPQYFHTAHSFESAGRLLCRRQDCPIPATRAVSGAGSHPVWCLGYLRREQRPERLEKALERDLTRLRPASRPPSRRVLPNPAVLSVARRLSHGQQR